MRRAEAAYEADVLSDDEQPENDTFVGLGTRSRKRGFLAYGGAGGPPAVMGSGTVEGLEDSEAEMLHEEETRRTSRRGRRASRIGGM